MSQSFSTILFLFAFDISEIIFWFGPFPAKIKWMMQNYVGYCPFSDEG